MGAIEVADALSRFIATVCSTGAQIPQTVVARVQSRALGGALR
jgi:hypothetical protein